MAVRKNGDESLSKQKNEEASAPHFAQGREPYQKGIVVLWFKFSCRA
jgi:hypothetical protein